MAKGPVLIEIDPDTPAPHVADAEPVPELGDLSAPKGHAMRAAADFTVRRSSRLVRWFWGLALALLGAVLSVAAWDFVTGLLARNAVLGYTAAGLFAAFLAVLLVIAAREVAAFGRLARIDGLRHRAEEALTNTDLPAMRRVADDLVRLYKGREDTRWARDRFSELRGDQLDAGSLHSLAEHELLSSLDAAACSEVERAARQVATVTALVPLALADVVAALTANVRMIRRIAEIYGGRSGVLGSWRLTRAVMAHLVATGAVAIGDDLLEPVLGGSIVGKLSRRFGEGLINGALTARVGVAAMDVCRPLPFETETRPRVREIIKGSLGGFFTNNASRAP